MVEVRADRAAGRELGRHAAQCREDRVGLGGVPGEPEGLRACQHDGDARGALFVCGEEVADGVFVAAEAHAAVGQVVQADLTAAGRVCVTERDLLKPDGVGQPTGGAQDERTLVCARPGGARVVLAVGRVVAVEQEKGVGEHPFGARRVALRAGIVQLVAGVHEGGLERRKLARGGSRHQRRVGGRLGLGRVFGGRGHACLPGRACVPAEVLPLQRGGG